MENSVNPALIPDYFVVYKGKMFLRAGELQQWSSVHVILTFDLFFHVFESQCLKKKISLFLKDFEPEFIIDDDEFYFNLKNKSCVYKFRISTRSAYFKWKNVLKINS